MAHKPTERVLSILNLLSASPNLSLTDISTQLHIPKSTLSPILAEMVTQNYLYLSTDTNLYSIGVSSVYLADAYNQTNQIIPFLKNTMKKITNNVGEICQLGKLDGDQIFYILKEEPNTDTPIKIVSHVGKKLPAYCTALGKALLSQLSEQEFNLLYPSSKKLLQIAPKTITEIAQLKDNLNSIKLSGIASEYEEVNEHLCCFAVPLNINDHDKVALSITTPIFRMTKEKEQQIKLNLLNAKEKIESYARTI